MKNLKNTLLIICCYLITSYNIQAQTNLNNDIEIAPYINSSVEGIPFEAQSILFNKMGDILVQNGTIKGVNSMFILTANTNVLSKEITATVPQMHVYEFQLTYFIGNGVDGTLFALKSYTIKGIGTTETKAYIDAFKNINTTNIDLGDIIRKAKSKIIEYYNSNCDIVLLEASKLERLNRFEEALYKLTSIPETCRACYTKSIAKAEIIYKKSIDFDCKIKLTEATQIWNSNPNSEGAYQSSGILKLVNPQASCFGEVKSLGKTISKKMIENDAREWNLYYEKEVGLEKDKIESIKEIGKAYGQGQPKNVTYNIKSWW
jgi:hypothetical protein